MVHPMRVLDLNVKSTDRLHVDVIIQNHLPVDSTSEQCSGINILQKILIFLLGCVTGYQVIRVIRIFAITYPFE